MLLAASMLTNGRELKLWLSWMARGAGVNGDWQRGHMLHDIKILLLSDGRQ